MTQAGFNNQTKHTQGVQINPLHSIAYTIALYTRTRTHTLTSIHCIIVKPYVFVSSFNTDLNLANRKTLEFY